LIQVARELGCEDFEEHFIATVKKLGAASPALHKKGEEPEKNAAK